MFPYLNAYKIGSIVFYNANFLAIDTEKVLL